LRQKKEDKDAEKTYHAEKKKLVKQVKDEEKREMDFFKQETGPQWDEWRQK
jgi:hypothetical protein